MANVLVAEDEPLSALLLQTMLEDAGFSVTVVSDGKRALNHMYRHPVQLLVLDWLMPVMGGRDVLDARQLDPNLRRIPVVVVSSAVREEVAREAIELGAAQFLSKPYEPAQLIQLVRGLLGEDVPASADDALK